MTEVKNSCSRPANHSVSGVVRLEGAPVPVTGNRGSDLTGLGVLRVLHMLGIRHRNTDLSIHVALDLVQAVGA